MYISDIISQDGITDEIDRVCGSSPVEYSYRDKTARINAALDRYFELAFRSDKRWNFDDINSTSPPIEGYTITSGTNRYKLSDFTANILSVMRLEILNSAGTGVPLIAETFDTMGRLNPGIHSVSKNVSGSLSGISADTFQELYVNAGSGMPTHYTKYGDFLYLRPNPNYTLASALLLYFEKTLARHSFIRYTVSEEAGATFTTASDHGMVVNNTVVFATNGTIPTGITANTIYYIKTAPSDTTFTIAPTLGGTAVEITANQTGSVQMCLHTDIAPGIPAIHHQFLARHASLAWLIDKSKPQAGAVSQLVDSDEKEIVKYFSERGKDIKSAMQPNIENNR